MKKTLISKLKVPAILLGFIILHFFPYFSQFTDSIFYFNDPDDVRTVTWNTWHFAEQLHAGNNPFYTDWLLQPEGTSLLMHAYTPFFGIINFFIGNVPLSINLGIVIQFLLIGIGFYQLSKIWLNNNWSKIGVAYIAMFNSYILAKLGVHINLVLVASVPFLIYFFIRFISFNPSKKVQFNIKYGIYFFLLLILQFLFDYYAIFFSLSFCAIYLIYNWLEPFYSSIKLRNKFIIIASIMLVGHITSKALRDSGTPEKGALWAAADIRQLFTPTNTSKFLKSLNIADIEHSKNDNKIFLGFGLIILFAFALIIYVRRKNLRKGSGILLFTSILFLLVSIPKLKWGHHTYFYSPTSIIHYIPFVNNVRAPDRFIWMAICFLSLFSFSVLEKELSQSKTKMIFLSVGFILISFIDHSMIKMKADINKIDPVYSQLNPELERILFLPFGLRDGYQSFGNFNSEELIQQRFHRKKSYSAYISRIEDSDWEKARNNVLLSSLVDLQNNKLVSIKINLKDQLKSIDCDGILIGKKYLDEHKELKHFLQEHKELKANEGPNHLVYY